MPLRLRYAIPVLCLLVFTSPGSAQDGKTPAKKAEGKSVEQLARDAKESLAVILYSGRDGKKAGLGTGFVISEDGLIATNLHVIGEGRPISVQLADGSKHEATVVQASDRKLDLAIIRIDAKKKLKPLPLGDSNKIPQGQAIVALGHPRGLEYSVVSGVLSGRRDMGGVSMLQLAIPIEQGNSGGPVLDPDGRVVGIVTMKSLVTANLGFAVPVNALKQIQARPNPVTMEQWLTIGALDKSEWKVLLGARWRQRAGRILVDGSGTGFGGRSLCLSQRKPLAMPFELAVTLKLDDEAGAAGLTFGGDASDRHFGFYPSGGKLRLTRFDGPTVFNWKILHDQASSAYRAGEWNTFKVRIEKDVFTCYVNDEQVAQLKDPEYFGGTVGLAKFRETVAEFKKFQTAPKINPTAIKAEIRSAFEKSLAKIDPESEVTPRVLAPLLKFPGDSGALLRDRASALEAQAAQLRKLARTVHHERCVAELTALFKDADAKVDLLAAALLVARIDNEELDIEAYRQDVDRLARLVSARFPKDAKDAAKIEALNKFLFQERGYHGSHTEYYSRSNSYLNEVIDDREGLPITLSVLYIEIARRLNLNVVGVPLPGHFVVRHEPKGQPGQLIDVFDGKPISREAAEERLKKTTGRPATEKDFEATNKRAIVIRMLHNLINVAESEKDRDGMLRYLDGIIAIDADAYEERWARAIFRFQAGRRSASLLDCEYLLKQAAPDTDLDRVRELKRILEIQKN